MIKERVNIWGRGFSLPVAYRCRANEEVPDSQIEAKESIFNKWQAIDAAKPEVEKYCLKRDGDVIGEKIENIFKYVIPTELLVLRDSPAHKVALMCNYRFDPEHGIAVIFKNERFLEVIPQDEI